jgi:CHAD domain-containing protein
MSAEIGRTEANAQGVRRVLCEQIDEATHLLGGRHITDGDIHSARKALKRARATLRLLRPAIPAKVFERENVALRDVARPLSAARDARALLDSLTRLAKIHGGPAKQSIPAAFRRKLARELKATQGTVGRQQSKRDALIRDLGACRERILTARIRSDGWDDICAGLTRVYRSGRKAMKQACKTPTPECLHEWRKQAKYLWHQLQLLEPISPGPIGSRADEMHKLSDYLGDDHDLAVLREQVTSHADTFPPPGGPAALLALIDRCQDRLRVRAFFTGRRAYGDKPAEFSRRFGRYWRRSKKQR